MSLPLLQQLPPQLFLPLPPVGLLSGGLFPQSRQGRKPLQTVVQPFLDFLVICQQKLLPHRLQRGLQVALPAGYSTQFIADGIQVLVHSLHGALQALQQMKTAAVFSMVQADLGKTLPVLTQALQSLGAEIQSGGQIAPVAELPHPKLDLIQLLLHLGKVLSGFPDLSVQLLQVVEPVRILPGRLLYLRLRGIPVPFFLQQGLPGLKGLNTLLTGLLLLQRLLLLLLQPGYFLPPEPLPGPPTYRARYSPVTVPSRTPIL